MEMKDAPLGPNFMHSFPNFIHHSRVLCIGLLSCYGALVSDTRNSHNPLLRDITWPFLNFLIDHNNVICIIIIE